ncbi:MAG: hypothetical protein P9E24_02085 [Candidatus Competibacter sp.]|nr:hypothetical protein [Candidatus Competibacter sp.]MDG4583561.1 hypothetical protein [Candidatus Competibacter sp.]
MMMSGPVSRIFRWWPWMVGLAAGFGAGVAAGDAPFAERAAVCQDRPACRIVEILDAGTAADGAVLAVLHVALGADDQAADAEGRQCRPYPEDYWLRQVGRDGKTVYRRLFSFCNDGYGASGVGEDAVTVGPNRITLDRVGGSAWRWEIGASYRLAPEQPLLRREASYHTLGGGCLETETDFQALRQRGWLNPPLAEEAPDEDATVGCDRESAVGRFVAIPQLERGDELAAELEQQSAGLGGCALTLKATGDGENGFVVHGDPDLRARTEIKLLLLTANTLLAQVRDPGRTPAVSSSWINDDRLELWLGSALYGGWPSADRKKQLYQFGIRLADGAVFAGYGKPARLPAVRHWRRDDARLLLVDWSDTGLETNSVTVVYGQGDGRRQGRMLATSTLKYGNPDTLGQFWTFPAACMLRNGILNVGELRSETIRMESENTAE